MPNLRANLYRLTLAGLLVMLASGLHAAESKGIHCEHFWVNAAGNLQPSGRVVGKDVGKSPFTTASAYASGYGVAGAYQCELQITAAEAEAGLYLFIGEVGDAAYLEVSHTPDGASRSIDAHGLSRTPGKQPVYRRPLPWWVPLSNIYTADGSYLLTIHYRDLVFPQTGIRSGPPSIEGLAGLLQRAVLGYSRTYVLFEALVMAAMALLIFVFWRQLEFKQRLRVCCSGLVAAACLVCASSVPRMFMDPILAIRINDIVNALGLPLLHVGLASFVAPSRYVRRTLYGFISVVAALCVLSLFYDPNDSGYLVAYTAILLSGSLLMDIVGLGFALRGRLDSNADYRGVNHVLGILALLVGIGVIDFVNNALLSTLSEFFISHYCYFATCFLAHVYLASTAMKAESQFNRAMQLMRNEAQQSISENWAAGDPLDVMAQRMGEILGSKRVSLAKIDADTLQIVGSCGAYTDPHRAAKVDPLSPVLRAIKENRLWRAQRPPRAPELQGLGQTDCLIMPLVKSGFCSGALSLTDFVYKGQMPSFFRGRLKFIRSECESIFFGLLRERDLRSSHTLMKWTRMRVHPLQVDSEMFFLRNFSLSETITEFAFIAGDVVDSSIINTQYGGETLAGVVDAHLQEIFTVFRELGVIVSRDKGDFISIMVPSQKTDVDSSGPINRAYQVLRYFNDQEARLAEIARAHGVVIGVSYRLAMSSFSYRGNRQTGATMASFTLMNDSEIDRACRAVAMVAVNAECLVLERAYSKITDKTGLAELPARRVKGQAKEVVLYHLLKLPAPGFQMTEKADSSQLRVLS